MPLAPSRARRPALIRLIASVALVASVGCRSGEKSELEPVAEAAPPPAAGQAPAPQVRLVVLLVIDQLPSWALDAALPSLEGGIARLARSGVHYTRAELPYSNTYTAAGHAALGTGAPPSVSGIMANDWHRETGNRTLSATIDPDDLTLLSSRQLRVDGVADVLERATGGASHTVSISIKDRAAILMTGRKPDLAVWYEPESAAMTTNRFYAAQTPRWLRELASDRPPSRFFREKWRPIDQAAVAALAGSGDDQPGELGMDGLDGRFPHSMAEVPSAAEAIINTPFATEILFDAAEAAVRGEAMGADAVPDLLALSISSHDYAAHGWGMESWERADVLLRLDQRLGAFLEHLDGTIGADRYAVVLSSDHGGMRLIERQQAAGAKVFRIEKADIRAAAERAAERALGSGPWVRGVSGNLLHVMPAFHDQAAHRRELAIHDMVAAVRAVPGIGFAASTADLVGDCARQADPMRRLACNSLAPGHLGPIIVLAADGSHISGDHPWGASHGGPSVDERTIPVIIVAPGRSPERRDAPVSMLSVAPTVAAILGVASPPAAREPAL